MTFSSRALPLGALLLLACRHPGGGPSLDKAPSADLDGDGLSAEEGDCDDQDALVRPGVEERCGSGKDEDCDGSPGDCSLSGDHLLSESTGRALGSVEAETGRAIAAAGDLNHDGRMDLLIASRKEGPGSVALFLGPVEGESATTEADATLQGFTVGDDLGRSVAGLSDTDGDGYDDLLIASLGLPGGPSAAGAAWLVSGPLLGAFPIVEIADAHLFGEVADEGLALAVACGGDTDGDGLAELLVGIPQGNGGGAHSGQVSLVLGPLSTDRPFSAADAILHGEGAGDFAGTALSSAGDVDGDGLSDLLIGAWGSTAYTGRAYLIRGPLSGSLSLADADASWSGAVAWDALGWSVARAGDTDGDGKGDILIGAYGQDEPDYSAGAVYLLQDPLEAVSLLEATAWFQGEASDDRLGWAVAGAGDTDGDGLDDLLLGAPGSDRAAAEGGDVALFLSPVGGVLSAGQADAHFSGDSVGANAGYSLAGLGDTNGDRTSDLLIGGPGAGAAWLVAGYGW